MGDSPFRNLPVAELVVMGSFLSKKIWVCALRAWFGNFFLGRILNRIKPCVLSLSCTSGALEPGSATSLNWNTNVSFPLRSEEHTSELQSLMRISYSFFC